MYIERERYRYRYTYQNKINMYILIYIYIYKLPKSLLSSRLLASKLIGWASNHFNNLHFKQVNT